MTKVIAEISMSLDGFVTGPNPGPDNGLGDGGEPLHTWALASDDPLDAEVLQESAGCSGAVIMGRRLFDIIDGPQGWNDDIGHGGGLATTPPFLRDHPPRADRRAPRPRLQLRDRERGGGGAPGQRRGRGQGRRGDGRR